MKRNFVLAGVVSVAVLFGGSAAMASSGDYGPAGTDNESYSTTVGNLGGYGYTGYQEKEISGTAGYGHSSNVGGSYSVSARMSSGGSWTGYVIHDDQNYYLYNSVNAGTDVRIQFKNSYTTPVDVQVSGYWRSN